MNETIKVISFNLKSDFKYGKKNKWINRKEIAAQIIKDLNGSIIGVQELLPNMKKDFKDILNDSYSVLGMGRYASKQNYSNEHSDIIIKNNLLELKFIDTFWLSSKPNKTISRGAFAIFPRICTIAEVVIKTTGQKIRIFNTHFDHISAFARKSSVKTILKYMNEYHKIQPMPIILMGDLNAGYNSQAVKILRENLHEYPNIQLNDIYKFIDHNKKINTFHNFKGIIKHSGNPIDYIFVSNEFEIIDAYIYTESIEGKYASDHYPIVASLKLKT